MTANETSVFLFIVIVPSYEEHESKLPQSFSVMFHIPNIMHFILGVEILSGGDNNVSNGIQEPGKNLECFAD